MPNDNISTFALGNFEKWTKLTSKFLGGIYQVLKLCLNIPKEGKPAPTFWEAYFCTKVKFLSLGAWRMQFYIKLVFQVCNLGKICSLKSGENRKLSKEELKAANRNAWKFPKFQNCQIKNLRERCDAKWQIRHLCSWKCWKNSRFDPLIPRGGFAKFWNFAQTFQNSQNLLLARGRPKIGQK